MALTNSASAGPTRRDMLRAAVASGVTAALPIGFAGPAAADPQVAAPATTGFYLGSDGRLYHAGSGATTAVGSAVTGPAGSDLSAVQRQDGSVVVFFIGNHGGLVAVFIGADGTYQGTARHPQSGLAPPGGRIAAVEGQTGTHVHFPGTNGAIYHATYGRSGAISIALAPLAKPGTVSSTSPLAAFQVAGKFGVVFAGANGSVQSAVGQIVSGPAGPIAGWSTTAATGAGAVGPGTPLAAASGANTVAAFYTGPDGRLWRIPFSAVIPRPAVPLSNPGAAPIRAHLAAAIAPTGEFVVAYAGADGAIRAATDAFGPMPNPWSISAKGVHVPGGPVSATYNADDILMGWCGNDRWIWLQWRWLRRPPPPPPPPDPYHQLHEIFTVSPVRPNYDISVTQRGLAGR